jgi:gliding motility-associated-like protein
LLESNVLDILPGATFTENYVSVDTVICTICWTYQSGYSGFIINIIPKTIECVQSSSKFSINLNIPPYLNVSDDISICGIQTPDLSATGQGPITWTVISGEAMSPTNFSCNQCNTPVATPSITTTYLVEDNSICQLTETVTVKVADNFGGIDVDIFTPDDSLCPLDCIDVKGFTEEETNIPKTAGPWTWGGPIPNITEDVPTNSIVDVPVPVAVAQMAPFTTIQPGMICEVCVDIEHPKVGDLKLDLVAPDGAVFTLSDQNGGAGANYLNTCFTMTHPNGLALPNVALGALAPFPGPHLPQGNLSTALIGSPIATTSGGAWRLRVHNLGSTATAVVDRWSIKFCKDNFLSFPSSFFAWDNPDGMPLVDTVSPTICPQFGGQYILTAYNADFCFVNDTINIGLYPLPDPGNDATEPVCLDAGVIDLFSYLGGTPHPVGTWETSGNPVNPLINSADITDMQVFKYIAESVNGCLDSAFLTIDIIEVEITNTPLTMPLCNGDCNGEIEVIATTTGLNPLTYSISTPGTPNQAGNIFNNLCDGTYDVTAIYTLPSGIECTATSTGLTLVEPILLEITNFDVNLLTPAGANPVDMTTLANPLEVLACDYKSIPLKITSQGGNPGGTHEYGWYMDNGFVGLGQNWTSPSNIEGPGYVVLSDGFCPTDTAFFTLGHYDNIEPKYTVSDNGCVPLDVTLTDVSETVAGGNNAYQSVLFSFSNGAGTPTVPAGTSKEHTFNEAGFYDVTIDISSTNINTGNPVLRNQHTCQYSYTDLSQSITVYALPEVEFVANPAQVTVFEPSTTLQNISPKGDIYDATSFEWEFVNVEPAKSTEVSPSITFEEPNPGNYRVKVTGTNANDCAAQYFLDVQIINDVNIFAPNIFTPDGNSFNETWRVHINGIDIYEFELTIYNRFGQIVFQSFDSEATWDGTYGNTGNVVQDGTYPWVITAKDAIDDNKYQFKGTINIVK